MVVDNATRLRESACRHCTSCRIKIKVKERRKMNTRISAVAVALCAALAGNAAHAALTINELGSGAVTAQTLVSSLLAANSGMTVSNVQFVGTNFQGGQ